MTEVDVEDLTVEFDGEPAVDNVTLDVRTGELLGVVGANGAGKTTLLRAMNGTLSPSTGRVRLRGDDVSRLSHREVARRVSTLPQNTEVSFEFTVEEVVRMGRHARTPRFGSDPDPDAVRSAMQRVDVRRFADRSIADVSGGERQRVLLARCLAQQTPILLFDEPTASLDVHRAVEVLELVRGLVDEGKTAAASIHDLELAARFCDRVALLDEGRLHAVGEPRDVLTPTLLENAFGGRIALDHGDLPRLDAFDAPFDTSRGHVHVVGNGGRQADAVQRLWRRGYRVTAGALSRDDSHVSVVEALASDVVLEEPYSPVTEESRQRVRRLAEEADAVVVAPSSVPEGFVPNLEAVSGLPDVHLNPASDLDGAERDRCRHRLGDVSPSSSVDDVLTQL